MSTIRRALIGVGVGVGVCVAATAPAAAGLKNHCRPDKPKEVVMSTIRCVPISIAA